MVKFSSQFCTLSVRDIMAAIFDLITASEDKGLPNALRWLIHLAGDAVSWCLKGNRQTHLRHSSTINRWPLAEEAHITHRSWLKLLYSYISLSSYHWRWYTRENDEDSSTLGSEGIFYRDLHVIKCDIGSTSWWWIARFDGFCLNTFRAFHQDDSKSRLQRWLLDHSISAALTMAYIRFAPHSKASCKSKLR